MLNKKIRFAAGTLATTSALLLALAGTAAAAGKVDYTKMTPEQLAEHLIFESDSYDLNQPTQEGTQGRDRLEQDEIQKICSLRPGQELDQKTKEKVMSMARATIKYPAGGIKLGDWKKGRELAWSGFGYRLAHKPDNHAGSRQPGGNCYNCHEMATDRTGGNLGFTLTGYGARGTSKDVLKYTYEMLYNSNAYFPCTNMPRMGVKGLLNEEQISDIMAYLLDPASPVNKNVNPIRK